MNLPGAWLKYRFIKSGEWRICIPNKLQMMGDTAVLRTVYPLSSKDVSNGVKRKYFTEENDIIRIAFSQEPCSRMEDGMEGDCAKVEFVSGKKSQASELNKLGKNSQYSKNDYKLANIL